MLVDGHWSSASSRALPCLLMNGSYVACSNPHTCSMSSQSMPTCTEAQVCMQLPVCMLWAGCCGVVSNAGWWPQCSRKQFAANSTVTCFDAVYVACCFFFTSSSVQSDVGIGLLRPITASRPCNESSRGRTLPVFLCTSTTTLDTPAPAKHISTSFLFLSHVATRRTNLPLLLHFDRITPLCLLSHPSDAGKCAV